MSYQAEINDLIKRIILDECQGKTDVQHILEKAIEIEIISQNKSKKEVTKKYMDTLEKCVEGQ